MGKAKVAAEPKGVANALLKLILQQKSVDNVAMIFFVILAFKQHPSLGPRIERANTNPSDF